MTEEQLTDEFDLSLFKALSDIRPGEHTGSFSPAKKKNLPPGLENKPNYHDYNHLLSPILKRNGYRLYVNHQPGTSISAELYHENKHIGNARALISPYTDDKMTIKDVAIGDDPTKPLHRGKGLGTAMYEAVLGHAKNVAGVKHVNGHSHSSMAHAVHTKIAQKHGLKYNAVPNYKAGSDQHWESKKEWEKAPTGPYDDKYSSYNFMLKAEPNQSSFRAAAFRHPETKQVFETGTWHDIEQLPAEQHDNLDSLEQGFVTHDGTFLDRKQAAQYANASMKQSQGTEELRDKLHSYDKEAFGSELGRISGIEKSEDDIHGMLQHDDHMERILALKHSRVLSHHLLIAINDEHPDVRMAAASHDSINAPLLMELIRQCNCSQAADKLFDHPEFGDEHMTLALELKPHFFPSEGNGGEVQPEDPSA